MCAGCFENTKNDPRRRAFIGIGMIETLSIADTLKVMKEDGTFDGLPPMLDIKVYQDAGVAKFKSFTMMMNDTTLAKVDHQEVTVCLN